MANFPTYFFNPPATYSEIDKPFIGNIYDALIKQNQQNTSTPVKTSYIKSKTKNKKTNAGGFWVDGKYIPVKAATPQPANDLNTALPDVLNRLNSFQPQDFVNQTHPATADLGTYFDRINSLNLPDIGKAIMALNEVRAVENQNSNINNFNKGTSIANENNLFNLSKILNNTSNKYKDILNKEQQMNTNQNVKNLADIYKTNLANAKNNTKTKTLATLSNILKNLATVNATTPTASSQAAIDGIAKYINKSLGIKSPKGWAALSEKDLKK